jgi:hypothetical protein
MVENPETVVSTLNQNSLLKTSCFGFQGTYPAQQGQRATPVSGLRIIIKFRKSVLLVMLKRHCSKPRPGLSTAKSVSTIETPVSTGK